jgi:hypothetical protein
MVLDITQYIGKNPGTKDSKESSKGDSKGDLPKSDTLASKLWGLGKDLSSDKIVILIKWANQPTITGYYNIHLLIQNIKGADKLLTKEVPNYPFDTNALIKRFKRVEGCAKWTKDQIKTARRIFRFLIGKETIFRVNGAGGTGKTTLIVELALFLARKGMVFRIAIAAPTHKALKVMESRFTTRADSAVLRITKFESIHKLLGFESDFLDDGKQTFVQKKPKSLSKFDLIIIDEISMSQGEISELIILSKNVKIILSGDECQLPPVNEPNSILCTDQRIVCQSTLRQPVRNADPGVMKLCKALRNWIKNKSVPDWKSLKCERIKFYGSAKFPNKLKTNWMKAFLETDCPNPLILTWTRKQRNEYNIFVRETMLNGKRKNREKHKLKRFEVGERLILNDFYKVPETEKEQNPLRLYSSEQLIIMACKESTIENERLKDIYPKKPEFGMAIRVERDYRRAMANIQRVIGSSYRVWKLEVKRVGGKKTNSKEENFTINVIHESSVEQRANEMRLAQRYIMNLQNFMTRWNPSAARSLQVQIIKPMWKEFRRILIDPFCSVDYGSAMTSHSAQGSSYDDIWVDMQDILQNPNVIEARKCLYVAVTRPRGTLHILL